MRNWLLIPVACTALLSGCAKTPLAPTIAVTAGQGKTDEAFKADQDGCKQAAAQAVSGEASAANHQAMLGALTGVVEGAVTGNTTGAIGDNALNGAQTTTAASGSIQQQYDAAFSTCMAQKGDVVPGMQVAAAPPPPSDEPDHTVLQVQRQLIRVGYLHGGADGVAGPKTAAAISKFEQDHGITVDGVSSDSLLAALRAQPGAASHAPGWVMPPPQAAAAAPPVN